MERRRRLRHRYDFQRVRQRGRCWSSDVVVLCALAAETPTLRFGFVVGKRIGGAVIRNRVKRRLRAAARHLASRLRPGYDIIVIARGPIATRTSAQLGETLTGLLRQARLWQEASPSAATVATDVAHHSPAGAPTAEGEQA